MGTANQWERGTATQQPITRICSPGVVELVRSNLAPDFPLFHDPAPDLMNVTSLLSRTVLDFNFETLPHTVLVHCIIPASQPVLLQNFMPLFFANIVLDLETFPYYYLSCKSWPVLETILQYIHIVERVVEMAIFLLLHAAPKRI